MALRLLAPPKNNRKEYPYQGRYRWRGLTIYVENRQGSKRRGVDKDGKPWSVTMPAHYGEVVNTVANDGDPVDVFLLEGCEDCEKVYVFHTLHPGTQVYDEDKCVIGAKTAKEARRIIKRAYNRRVVQGMTIWPADEFAEYLRKGKRFPRLDKPKRVRRMLKGHQLLDLLKAVQLGLFGSGGAPTAAARRPPNVETGDTITGYNDDYTEVWSVGEYDDHAGGYRVQVMDPATRHKLWTTDTDLRPAPPEDRPPAQQSQTRPELVQVKPHARVTKQGKVVQVTQHQATRKKAHQQELNRRKALYRQLRAALAAPELDVDLVKQLRDQLPKKGKKADRLRQDVRAHLSAHRGSGPQAAATGPGGDVPTWAGKTTVKRKKPRLVAKASTYDPDAPAPEKTVRRSLDRLEARGRKLAGEGDADAAAPRRMNTARQQRQAASSYAAASARAQLGRRLQRYVEAVRGGYTPSRFDHAMATNGPARQLVSFMRYRRDRSDRRRDDPYRDGRYEETPPIVRGEMDLQHGSYRAKGREQAERLATRLNTHLKAMGRQHPNNPHNIYMPVDEATRKALLAIKKEAKKNPLLDVASLTDTIRDIGARLKVGWRSDADTERVIERYEQWLELTKPDGGPVRTSPVPDRSGARDPFDERMARAEAEEARRFLPHQLQGIPGFFETPPTVVERMIEEAGIDPGMSVLEPSAGRGGIADRLPDDVSISVAEHNHRLRELLSEKGYAPHEDAMAVPGTFDRVIMNPPFERGQDMEQVRHAYDHNLAEDGRLVAIMAPGWQYKTDKRSQAFRDWFDEAVGGAVEELPAGTFKRSGTGVSSVMVVVDK